MRESISKYEEAQRLMQIPPVTKPSTTHHPFANDATAIVKQDVTKEERKAKRDAINKYRYTGGKRPRVHKISLAEYNRQAKIQDETPKSERFGT
jgi:hypothetical protein